MPSANRNGRAAWVWAFDDADAVVAWAAGRGLGELFVHAPDDVDSHPARPGLTRLVGAARRRGLLVAALGGDPRWLDDPGEIVDHWLAPVLRVGLFDRVHLDIEPELSPCRPDPAVVARFVALVDAIAAAMPDHVPLESDVRFWYPDVPAGKRDLTSTLVSIVDAVTVLSYRNFTDGRNGSVAITHPTAAIASAAGIRFRVGQETLYLGPEPRQRQQTFHGRPRRELEAAMAELDTAFGSVPGYAGTAVHDWRGYADLRDR